ncbi:hypothetical protein [Calothrix sp. UHCC 0171]|nr:hypothetical protein [Calothrix sp. UHCC 0171]MEA5569551.1 hypothetical protein [Calothrix sp. UHCC 0171]
MFCIYLYKTNSQSGNRGNMRSPSPISVQYRVRSQKLKTRIL